MSENHIVAKKRSHRPCSIKTKMEIIRRSETGESFASIGRWFGLGRSTICSILKSKAKIKAYVENSGNVSTTIFAKRRGKVMEEMEKSLALWIDDQHQESMPVSISIIQAKALSLFREWKSRLKDEAADTPEFQASKGWFERFKVRATHLRSSALTEEVSGTVEEADAEFIKPFHDENLSIDDADIRAVILKSEPSINTTTLLNGIITDPLSSCTEEMPSESEPIARSICSDDAIILGELWAFEYSKLKPQQKVFAKKAISDILYTAGFEELHRNSVKINNTPHP